MLMTHFCRRSEMLRCLTWKTARSGQNKESSLQEVRRTLAEDTFTEETDSDTPPSVHSGSLSPLTVS